MNWPLYPLLLLSIVAAVVQAGCYDNWSRCTPLTAPATGILWKSCPEYCNKCLGRESGECVQVYNLVCSGGYQCQCTGGKVEKSTNPIVKATCALVFGLFLNCLLLILIIRCSKPNLGNYRSLLKLFACNDIFMLALHCFVQPASITTGSALGVFSMTFIENKYVIAMCCTWFTIPISLMNINFLHRYWAVRSPHKVQLFSNPMFAIKLFLCGSAIAMIWFIGCLGTTGNPAGKAIVQLSMPALQGISITDGWMILHFWDNDQLSIRGVGLLSLGATLLIGNFTAAGIFCFLTLCHLKSENMFSASYKSFQFKILRALLAQSAIPIFFVCIPFAVALSLPLFNSNRRSEGLDHWFTIFSSFPALDAIVIILLMKDYRNGLIGIVRGNYSRTNVMKTNWMTAQTFGRF